MCAHSLLPFRKSKFLCCCRQIGSRCFIHLHAYTIHIDICTYMLTLRFVACLYRPICTHSGSNNHQLRLYDEGVKGFDHVYIYIFMHMLSVRLKSYSPPFQYSWNRIDIFIILCFAMLHWLWLSVQFSSTKSIRYKFTLS